ncbi:MAG: hypothetical protein KKD75_04810 [Nanoarchaeota archaeon]|nr:hypothetical protein [Nanoarchaeota archaeon]MBU1632359.1 hypothetical protein [Nanoarchaeota archaeon]
MTQELEILLANESKGWDAIQRMRQSFDLRLFANVAVKSTAEAFERGVAIVKSALNVYEELGIDYRNAGPGHSIGHLTRDYVHAVKLASELDIDPKHLFIGFVGAILHDSGCTLIERFEESKRAVRHAEAGALLFTSIASQLDVNDAEKVLIAYAIAAHTHYLTPSTVNCSDKITREVNPYIDLDGMDQPLIGIWLPRWVDRLDCNGPCFVGRHYLNMAKDHTDYDGQEHFDIKYATHLQPRLLPETERRAKKLPQTMLEHMNMITESQTNNSPYGKHDFDAMVKLRDHYKKMSFRIIDTVQKPHNFSSLEQENINKAWNLFLSHNIEPTEEGMRATQQLKLNYAKLEDTTSNAWDNGFLTTMKEYVGWSKDRMSQLNDLEAKYGSEILSLPGITTDVRKVIKPHTSWIDLVNSI